MFKAPPKKTLAELTQHCERPPGINAHHVHMHTTIRLPTASSHENNLKNYEEKCQELLKKHHMDDPTFILQAVYRYARDNQDYFNPEGTPTTKGLRFIKQAQQDFDDGKTTKQKFESLTSFIF